MLQIITMVLWALCAAGLAYYTLTVSRNITYVVLADGRRQERNLPLTFRLLLPFAPNLTPYFRRPQARRAREKSAALLLTAGFEGLLSAEEFLALRVITPLVFGTLWTILIVIAAGIEPSLEENAPLLILLGFVLFALQPSLWLRQTIKKRHTAIQRAMPFMIDLLTLSVEAGVDFMSALQRAVEKRKMDPLTEELIRVIHEIQLGSPRRVALRNLALRVNMPDMRSFAFALIQADELGVSIGTILRIQSEQIRQKRFDRAERLANEAPVKMLMPLMLFIFPAVFIVLLGPILSRVVGGL